MEKNSDIVIIYWYFFVNVSKYKIKSQNETNLQIACKLLINQVKRKSNL